MRRMILAILILCLLVPHAGADTPKYVAITFDDGPSGQYTQRLLEGLAERKVCATFFLCGYRLEHYGNLAPLIRAHGHEIGLHGYSHRNLSKMSSQAVFSELSQTRALLPDIPLIYLMRAPGGNLSKSVLSAAKEDGLSVIQWSVDPEDWAVRDAEVISRRVLDSVRDGDVILLHDMTDATVDAAFEIIDTLHARGYRFLTVSQLAMLRLTHLTPGQRYDAFYPYL